MTQLKDTGVLSASMRKPGLGRLVDTPMMTVFKQHSSAKQK